MTKLPDFNHHPANAFARFLHRDSHPGLTPYAYALHQRMAEGHICLDVRDEALADEAFWSDYAPGRPDPLPELPTDHPLVGTIADLSDHPLAVLNGKLYLSRYLGYEAAMASRLAAMAQGNPLVTPGQLEGLREHIATMRCDRGHSGRSEAERPDWQLVAALSAAMNRFTVITGGPGTGKTTTVAKVLSLLWKLDPSLRVGMAAPTGKAAVRMQESLAGSTFLKDPVLKGLLEKRPPSTIHRLLGSRGPKSRFFKHHRGNPLPYDVVIVDEASMIGLGLFAKLVDALPADGRLILLGDPDQLTSVETGSVFGDICRLLQEGGIFFDEGRLRELASFMESGREIPTGLLRSERRNRLDGSLVRLVRNYRNDADNHLAAFTRAIVREGISSLPAPREDDGSLLLDTAYDEDRLREFILGYADYIREEHIPRALQLLSSRRILCALRGGRHGVIQTNRRAEQVLAAHIPGFRPSGDFYEHQPILITRNLQELKLWNGDIGIVRRSPAHGGQRMVFFPAYDENDPGYLGKDDAFGGYKAIQPGFLFDKETVFAMTIHKSQGSEFSQVAVLLPEDPSHRLLSRELVYTAVSRAKEGGKVLIQAAPGVVEASCDRQVSRISGMHEHFPSNH